MRMKLGFGVAAAALASVVAFGQPAPPPDPYLPGDRAPDTLAILPPPPTHGSLGERADRAIFRATRALRGTPRWALAMSDVADSVPSLEKALSCAADAPLDPQSAPRLTAMMSRARADVGVATTRPKAFYRRPRPYLLDKGQICVPKSASLAQSPDYPSGHATWGWTWGLILAELDPQRQTQILTRARAYGESRVVCGVHSASAVGAARTNAAALVAALHGDRAFRADLEGVRSELAALRANHAPASPECAAEEALVAKTPW